MPSLPSSSEPVVPAAQSAGATPEKKAPPAIILLIDDDRAVRESVSRVLLSEGYHVITAAGGGDALDVISDCRPALIITDLCMGPVTGWDLMLHLQNHLPGVPIFVITALPPKSTGGADRAATHFFQKPLDFEALLAAIHRQLHRGPPSVH